MLVQLGNAVTASLVVVGVCFGLIGGNIQARTDWIVGLLYGSYVAANVLKWIWWRFNAVGFFAGMLSGMVGVAVLPPILRANGLRLLAIEQFPLLLIISLAGCLLGRLSADGARRRLRVEEFLPADPSLGFLGADSVRRYWPRTLRFAPIRTSAEMLSTS